MAKRKYFRTVVTIEILSEGDKAPSHDILTPFNIGEEIMYGSWSGSITINDQDEVTPLEMADLLVKQGSCPEFLGLLEDGSPDPDQT